MMGTLSNYSTRSTEIHCKRSVTLKSAACSQCMMVGRPCLFQGRQARDVNFELLDPVRAGAKKAVRGGCEVFVRCLSARSCPAPDGEEETFGTGRGEASKEEARRGEGTQGNRRLQDADGQVAAGASARRGQTLAQGIRQSPPDTSDCTRLTGAGAGTRAQEGGSSAGSRPHSNL